MGKQDLQNRLPTTSLNIREHHSCFPCRQFTCYLCFPHTDYSSPNWFLKLWGWTRNSAV